ncbi:Ubiquitin-conjugating enzyme E2 S [Brachionus plicatilis]|uniref:E2 ubiquitin-conjugating enzyme n=1 Tax=Brachionus plicatilis TaxID=10195 RepID=A0A3M7QWJ6_BRAPC|nr:Ubiquitin-conjugating enzyme E2 S [Brachionus plicatilis]
MSSNTENIPPQVIKRILKEIAEISSEPLDGIKLISNDQDVSDIQALIDGPADTPFFGGLFRVKLILSKGFPVQPPKAFFITKIFHPNVSSNGEICVNTLKKDWKPELGIKHVLLTIKCLLIVPNPESALNEEAGKLLLEEYEEYFSRAKLYTEVHARHSLTLKSQYPADNNIGSKSSSSSNTNPLDSNKTIPNSGNNTANQSSSSDEPNIKMAKLQSNVSTAKKNDKKKALKRL